MKPFPKKIIFTGIKLLIGFALGYILFARLSDDFSKFDPELYKKKLSETKVIFFLSLTVILMPLNWIIESVKWKIIISRSLEKMSFLTAVKSVVTGVAFGNLAPGRATEFAGKILFVSEGNRVKASFLHFVAGSSQLMVTIIFGVIAFFVTGFSFFESRTSFYIFAFLLALLFSALTFFFFNPQKVFSFLQKFKVFKKLSEGKIEVQRSTLLRLFFLSVLRHAVFSFQYFLVIKCFFSSEENMTIINGIFLSYLLMSVIPMFSPAEAFMRGGIGVMIFSAVEPDSMRIFISSTLIWIINIVVPSVIGYLIFLFRKLNSKQQIN